jgi:magnesium transporter
MAQTIDHLQQPVVALARKDFPLLRREMTVQEAFDTIRERGAGEKIIYFYVVDEHERLMGVLPTRRLLTARVDQRLSEIMIPNVVAIPHSASVLDACEFFVMHKFLAFPVVDEEQHVVGVVNVDLLTDEVFDIAERETMDELFEAIGFHIQQVRDASPARAFRFRFPWLLATIGSGLMCAVLASAFELTLAKSIALAFFMTLVLALGESVSIQSMTLTIQALRTMRPTWRWYVNAFRREMATALLLGVGCGAVVGLVVWLWKGGGMLPIAIAGSIVLSLCMACLAGLSVPAILHALKLDPKISAGPVTLALTDVATLLFYFTVATLLL